MPGSLQPVSASTCFLSGAMSSGMPRVRVYLFLLGLDGGNGTSLIFSGTPKSGWPMERLMGSLSLAARSKTLRMPDASISKARRAMKRGDVSGVELMKTPQPSPAILSPDAVPTQHGTVHKKCPSQKGRGTGFHSHTFVCTTLRSEAAYCAAGTAPAAGPAGSLTFQYFAQNSANVGQFGPSTWPPLC